MDGQVECQARIRFSQIVAIAELVNVTLKVLTADTMELAEQAALQQCPETLNGICVDTAIYIPILMLNEHQVIT